MPDTSYVRQKMLRFLLLSMVVITTKASDLSLSEIHGLQHQPRLISQSVNLREVPTKIIKITKTVAIKVPVPYPVKVPHHIPVPVPVNHPVAIPVPQIVKVPHHVPIEVARHVPVQLHQQVPLVIPRPVPVPQPIPVPHPVNIRQPVYYPVPHPIPYQNFGSEHPESFSGHETHGNPHEYSSNHDDEEDLKPHEQRSYTYYTVESPNGSVQHYGPSNGHKSDDFQPSKQDYNDNQ